MTTKQKLIKAGLELFGKNGYDATSTRDICSLAGVNSASIGYHFGDKRSLYLAVLEAEVAGSRSLQKKKHTGTPEEQLLHIVQTALTDVYSSREGPRGQLALREVTDPSDELIEMIQESLTQQFNFLLEAVAAIAGPNISEQTVKMMALSVIGQIEHHRFHHRFLPFFVGKEDADALSIEFAAKHIVDFSVAGIRCYKEHS